MKKTFLLAPALVLMLLLSVPLAHAQQSAATVGNNSAIQLQTVTPNQNTGSYVSGSAPSGINTTELNLYKGGILLVINSIAMPVLVAIAFLVFLWGVAKAYIIHGASESDREKGHEIIKWGIAGFVIIFSVWGIIWVVIQILGLGGAVGTSASGAGLTPPQL